MIEVNEKQLSSLIEEDRLILYLYTPFCGTCQLAKRMLTVVDETVPETDIHMANLNYLPGFPERWEVESVPCLLIFEKGKLHTKQYAFQSVEFLYKLIKQNGA
ncbi:thioredoxin family protein [Metabacillus sp. 84]|uniref:thioredoxin family protein n=1 Tax=Metabacillus sp. 84 TaxID=3404705 RepID=UPI003CF5CE35